jgi:hypothetical protein
MLNLLNRLFIAFVILIAFSGICLSLLLLGLDFVVGGDPVSEEIAALEFNPEIMLYSSESSVVPEESPYGVNMSLLWRKRICSPCGFMGKAGRLRSRTALRILKIMKSILL